jgi:FemAB-related protein (PEP-CTERM system-associated)
MTIYIRLATDEDQDSWNHYIKGHPNVSPYHHFAWKRAIEQAYGHRCFYLIAEDQNKVITGVLPATLIKPPLLGGKLCSLPFCDLGASLANDETIEQQLIDKAIEIATQNSLSSVEYRASAQSPLQEGEYETMSNNQKVRMLLDLPKSSETLLTGFKSKLRSQIRKAQKNGLIVELGNHKELIDEFYDVFSCNMRDLGSPTHSLNWFREINQNYQKDMIISIVKYQGQPVAAGIVLFSGPRAAIPWASTRREFNRLSPNMLLYWSLLEYASDNGFKTFDFGRSSFNEGTYKFKQQWGAKPVPLKWKNLMLAIDEENDSITHSKSNLRELVETIWRKLPLKLTIFLGSRIRKFISL